MTRVMIVLCVLKGCSLFSVVLLKKSLPVHEEDAYIRSSILFTKNLMHLSCLLPELIQYLLVPLFYIVVIVCSNIEANRSLVFHYTGELYKALLFSLVKIDFYLSSYYIGNVIFLIALIPFYSKGSSIFNGQLGGPT